MEDSKRQEQSIDKHTGDFIRMLNKVANSIHALRFRNHCIYGNVIINSSALAALSMIESSEGDNSLEIGREMGVSKSAVSQVISKLESIGLVEKRKKEGNRKEVYPYLTAEGRTCVNEYRSIRDRYNQDFDEVLSHYDEDQKKAIFDFLVRSNKVLNDFNSQYKADGENYEW